MPEVEPDIVSTSFAQFMKQNRSGQLEFECAEALEKVVKGVRETCKKGKLTVTFEVSCLNRGDPTVLAIVGEVDPKVPKKDVSASIFFPTEQNTLQRTDPNQGQFELD